MQKKLSFIRPNPSNIRIDYDNMIIYYDGCDQGQHVFNFIYLYKTWELIIFEYQSEQQRNVIENWKQRYEGR